MTDDGDPGETAADLALLGQLDERSLVVPSADVWAVVRWRDLPESPPDELVAFTARTPDDWVLTDDAVAFGEHGVIESFTAWRSSWDRTWVLDPLSSLERLVDFAEAASPSLFSKRCARGFATGDDVVFGPDVHAHVVVDLERLAAAVRRRDATGIGLVDTTPGSQRVGLARAWPAWGSDELLAACEGVEVHYRPATGLVLETGPADLRGADRGIDVAGPIERAICDGERWTITCGGEGRHLDHRAGRPLAWLVPNSTGWRVRRVPEVVTWARTFHRLRSAFEFATAHGRAVRLTTYRPVAGHGASIGR
jgi:hypothetical protein